MFRHTVAVPIKDNYHAGILRTPEKASGLVIFAHGSGSGISSPRNNFVADVLSKAGIASLLFDLLTEKEDLVYENRFNIELLTERLIETTLWTAKNPDAKNLSVKSPTLLIVGDEDEQIIELNKIAFEALKSKKKFAIIPGATHLFEEPGTLEKVADLAKDWFKKYLASQGSTLRA